MLYNLQSITLHFINIRKFNKHTLLFQSYVIFFPFWLNITQHNHPFNIWVLFYSFEPSFLAGSFWKEINVRFSNGENTSEKLLHAEIDSRVTILNFLGANKTSDIFSNLSVTWFLLSLLLQT